MTAQIPTMEHVIAAIAQPMGRPAMKPIAVQIAEPAITSNSIKIEPPACAVKTAAIAASATAKAAMADNRFAVVNCRIWLVPGREKTQVRCTSA
jgi:hypothetical protein